MIFKRTQWCSCKIVLILYILFSFWDRAFGKLRGCPRRRRTMQVLGATAPRASGPGRTPRTPSFCWRPRCRNGGARTLRGFEGVKLGMPSPLAPRTRPRRGPFALLPFTPFPALARFPYKHPAGARRQVEDCLCRVRLQKRKQANKL